jgi:hypothetical protein
MNTTGNEAKSRHRQWDWVQFVCAFVLATFIAFISISVFSHNIWFQLTKSLAAGCLCGTLAARYGDAIWHRLVEIFRWL